MLPTDYRTVTSGLGLNKIDSHGNTSLHRAIWYGPNIYSDGSQKVDSDYHQKVVQGLIDAGVDVNAVNNYGQTPLHKTAQLAKPHLARLLLERGACVSIKDRMGNTPLHETTALDDKATAKLLLERKAEINARNNFEKTPLAIAYKVHSIQVVKVLQSQLLQCVEKREITPSNLPKSLKFIHHESIGNLKQCEAIFVRIAEMIREVYDSNKVSGCSHILVKSYEDAQSKFILNIDLIARKLDNRYPFVLIIVSPFDEYVEDITEFMASKGYM